MVTQTQRNQLPLFPKEMIKRLERPLSTSLQKGTNYTQREQQLKLNQQQNHRPGMDRKEGHWEFGGA